MDPEMARRGNGSGIGTNGNGRNGAHPIAAKRRLRSLKLDTPEEKLPQEVKGVLKRDWLFKHKEELEASLPPLSSLAQRMTLALKFHVSEKTLGPLMDHYGIKRRIAGANTRGDLGQQRLLQDLLRQVIRISETLAQVDETFEVNPRLYQFLEGDQE